MMAITAHDSHYAQFENAELNNTGDAYSTLRDLDYELEVGERPEKWRTEAHAPPQGIQQ